MLPVFLLGALTGCRTYDESVRWSDEESPVTLELDAVERGVASITMTNSSESDQYINILPQSSIIGYRRYLSGATQRNLKPGHLRGESRIVRSSGGSHMDSRSSQDIYGSFTLSHNGFILPAGETKTVELRLGNWDRATENFISRVHVMVTEGDLKTRVELQIPAEYFFDSAVTSYGSSGHVNFSGSLRFRL
ncbi:MAG: hypothetical protein PQJ50_03750 [Spirochaetales bacterium]|nr:hypothetical protein [Spirochaetales bacterium]